MMITIVRQCWIVLPGKQRWEKLPCPVVHDPPRVVPLIADLHFQIHTLAVHGHVDIQPAEFVPQVLRRHLRIPYHKLPNTFQWYPK